MWVSSTARVPETDGTYWCRFVAKNASKAPQVYKFTGGWFYTKFRTRARNTVQWWDDSTGAGGPDDPGPVPEDPEFDFSLESRIDYKSRQARDMLAVVADMVHDAPRTGLTGSDIYWCAMGMVRGLKICGYYMEDPSVWRSRVTNYIENNNLRVADRMPTGYTPRKLVNKKLEFELERIVRRYATSETAELIMHAVRAWQPPEEGNKA